MLLVPPEDAALQGADPSRQLIEWVKGRGKKIQDSVGFGTGTAAAAGGGKTKVSLLALLSYSTYKEKWLMALGLVMAFFSGLGLPLWLALLARSLDKFSNLAKLIDNVGLDQESLKKTLEDELNQMVIAFVYVGALMLGTGAIYVTIWTYTGERQALRIQERFVHSALQQDASWFDTHDRQELPTQIAMGMVHLQNAIGRQMATTFANLCSALGCLAVALILNAPLALVMLCVVPIVFICVAILSCFIQRQSQKSSDLFSKAGALATEVISGMKTVASLCAQPWALEKYETFARASQKHSIWSGILASCVAGVTGLLFYSTYTLAFVIGTDQVAKDMEMATIVRCFFDDNPNCRVTGASIMCCIYGVILCATFFGLMAPGIQAINLGRQAAVDVFATIERVPEIDASSEQGTTLETLRGELEFRNVLFAYPSRPNNIIFRDFNLRIKPGQSLALCGPRSVMHSQNAFARFIYFAGCMNHDTVLTNQNAVVRENPPLPSFSCAFTTQWRATF